MISNNMLRMEICQTMNGLVGDELTGMMEYPKLRTLAQRVIWARKRKQISQYKLADMVGIGRDAVMSIENGRTLRPRKMKELAIALDIDAAWLAFGHRELNDLSEAAIKLALDWDSLDSAVKEALRIAIEEAAKKRQ